jgi:integrase
MWTIKRGNIWWYGFRFAGRDIRESSKSTSKTIAKKAAEQRHRELVESFNGLESRDQRVRPLQEVSCEYLEKFKLRSPRSVKFVSGCLLHLNRLLGHDMVITINQARVEWYQNVRKKEGAANKTINEEVSLLLRVLQDQGDVLRAKMKRSGTLKWKVRNNIGKALSHTQQNTLIDAADSSLSAPFRFAVVMALNTGCRDSEMKSLQWHQLDLEKLILTVGKSKTDAGDGRTIPINRALLQSIVRYRQWYLKRFEMIQAKDYVFPFGRDRHYDKTRPVTTFKTAWQNLKKRSGIEIRWHDLRHTVGTNLAESGATDETIMALMGHVSRSMLTHYSHIRTEMKRKAMESIQTKRSVLRAVAGRKK